MRRGLAPLGIHGAVQPRPDGVAGPRDAGRRPAPPPPSTPLEIVSAAVAGEDLSVLAGAAAEALGRPVAIVIPALGEPLVAPAGSVDDEALRGIARYARALVAGSEAELPAATADALPVRIGEETVGIVAAPGDGAAISDPAMLNGWLDATATAASVTALIRSVHEGGVEGSRRALLSALRSGPPSGGEALVSHARKLGIDLSAGAVAVCGRPSSATPTTEVPAAQGALVAELGDGGVYGLVPLAGDRDELATTLADAGMEVAVSSPRRDPAALHEALREAELLLELGAHAKGHDQIYRLLLGVLFRDPGELEQLRAQTIAPLMKYDAEHDTELVATLHEFLQHHGSTTEAAEAMQLHRHTVGYRLARVHEVSALSPYESEGRERLSLGLKAHQILAAHERLGKPG
jgi:hypothetical protein